MQDIGSIIKNAKKIRVTKVQANLYLDMFEFYAFKSHCKNNGVSHNDVINAFLIEANREFLDASKAKAMDYDDPS